MRPDRLGKNLRARAGTSVDPERHESAGTVAQWRGSAPRIHAFRSGHDSGEGVPRKMMPPKKGFTVWFTGLPSAGKSTLAELLAGKLHERGHRVEVPDGDAGRRHLFQGLGFSQQERDPNNRPIGFSCALFD